MGRSRRRSASVERERMRSEERAGAQLDADIAYLIENWHQPVNTQNRTSFVQVSSFFPKFHFLNRSTA